MSFERRAGFVVGVALIGGASAIEFSAACSFGTYDGSFDASAPDGGEARVGDDASAAVSRTAQPQMDTTITTADSAFEVTILKGTFSSPTTVEIRTLAERTLDTGLIVPAYAVAAGSEPPKLPVQVSFRGTSNNTTLVPSLQNPDGTFAALVVTGTGNQTNITGPNPIQIRPWWGLTKTFGTFSLEQIAIAPRASFVDEAAAACTACCASNGGGGGSPSSTNAATLQGGCSCAYPTDPNPACFIKNCADLAASAARCVALDATTPNGLFCRPSACATCMSGPSCPSYCTSGGQMTCGSNQPCCVDNNDANSPDMCLMTGGAACRGFSVRCERQTDCKSGSCCVVGQETLCIEVCPVPQRVCTVGGNECVDAGAAGGDAGACRASKYCPFGTCGTPPTGCQ